MRGRAGRALRALAVLGALAAAWYYLREPPPQAREPEVIQAEVSRGPVIETVRASGVIESLRRVNVGSQVSGTVTAIYADFNSVVRQGQLLAEIDPEPYEVRVAIQAANVARIEGEIASLEDTLDDQRRQLGRVEQLVESGLQPEVQRENALIALRNRETQMGALRSQRVQARASLAAAELNLSYTKIHAPTDGVVVMRRVDVGQTVQASVNTPSFFVLVLPLQTLKLNAGVDEASIGRVRPGQRVRFTIDTYADEEFVGTVETLRMNARVLDWVVTYPVWINVPNGELKLRPGMTARVAIEVSDAREVTRVPNDAFKFRPSRRAFEALGLPPPSDPPARAVDLAADRLLDPSALRPEVIDRNAASIDELFAPMPQADARVTVWTWSEERRELKPVTVRVGATDGDVSELIEGDRRPGDLVVTRIEIP
jgi:HlyD family secretion protein